MNHFAKATINNSLAFLKLHIRQYSLYRKLKEKQETSHLQRIFVGAEKILGDKTFRNVNWLIPDEVSDLGSHIKNVRDTDHPIAEVARNFVTYDGVTWGLIVMLFSKLTQKRLSQFGYSKSEVEEIAQIQYTIAKVTQMLYMTIRVHKSVINMASANRNYGNKVAILCGDYFLARCLNELATLPDQGLVEIMASAWRDLSITQFIGPRDDDNKPYPIKPKTVEEDISFLDSFSSEPIEISNSLDNSKTYWVLKNTLGDCGLLAKACLCVLRLAGYSQQYQNIGFSFGKYFGLAYQASADINSLNYETDAIDLVSLPVLLHLLDDEELYDHIARHKRNIEGVNCHFVRERVLNGRALNEATDLQMQYADAACSSLNIFDECDSQILLKDIIDNVKIGRVV